MSESVVVNFVANALWQLHRFLGLCLRHRGKLVELLLSRSSHSAQAGYLTAHQSEDEEQSGERQKEAVVESVRKKKEVSEGWGVKKGVGESKMSRCSPRWCKMTSIINQISSL